MCCCNPRNDGGTDFGSLSQSFHCKLKSHQTWNLLWFCDDENIIEQEKVSDLSLKSNCDLNRALHDVEPLGGGEGCRRLQLSGLFYPRIRGAGSVAEGVSSRAKELTSDDGVLAALPWELERKGGWSNEGNWWEVQSYLIDRHQENTT